MRFGPLKRRELVSLLGGAVAWPAIALAERREKIWRVGIMDSVPRALNTANLDAFHNGLRSLGYIEGQNLRIDYRSAEGEIERFRAIAAELVHEKVDVIVTRGTPAVVAAKQATAAIPVVMAASGEPLTSGVVAGLARPGGNVTGLSAFTNELIPKRIELLTEMVPGTTRIAFLQNMANPVAQSQWRELRIAAQSVGIEAVLIDVRKSADLTGAFEAAQAQRIDALIMGNDTVTQANRRQVVELAARHRLPASYASREFVDAGGLMVYAVNYADLYRRAAIYVDKIFKGAKPTDLPVEQPTKFDFIINLKTSKALGLTVPDKLLALANEVIE
jgi:putative tryptophan/tyrosine transport system substrate-binding protein